VEQPRQSPEIEFLIKALVMVTARTEAVCDLLQKRELIASKEQIENEALSIYQRILDVQRDNYITLLNLERRTG
jgi:hypothetical protein